MHLSLLLCATQGRLSPSLSPSSAVVCCLLLNPDSRRYRCSLFPWSCLSPCALGVGLSQYFCLFCLWQPNSALYLWQVTGERGILFLLVLAYLCFVLVQDPGPRRVFLPFHEEDDFCIYLTPRSNELLPCVQSGLVSEPSPKGLRLYSHIRGEFGQADIVLCLFCNGGLSFLQTCATERAFLQFPALPPVFCGGSW